MISPKTAKVLIYGGIFIVALIFSPLDLAITITASIYLLVNSQKIIMVVGAAIFLLFIDFLLRYFDISIRFISDLSLDGYLFFITAAVLYVKTQKNLMKLITKIREKGQTIYWKHVLSVILISLAIGILVFPLVGIHGAGIFTYLTFIYLFKRFEGRYAYLVALFFLIFSPFLIILKQDSLSENFAIFSFYFMILGTVQEGIRLAGVKKYDIEKLFSGVRIRYKQGSGTDKSFTNGLPINEGFIHIKTSFYSHASYSNTVAPSLVYKIVVPSILLFILCIIGYVLYLYAPKWTRTIPFTQQEPTIVVFLTPTVFITPTVTLVPTFSMSSTSAKLKIKVENGTKTTGLAASVSAKLKAAGFKDIKTEDAEAVFQKWEIHQMKEDPGLVQFIKNTLALSNIDVKQAAGGAAFDLVIIAGENK